VTKPPTPKQRRYRGRIRADIRSAYNHLLNLSHWSAKYLGGPVNNYPNQLAPPAEVNAMLLCAIQLSSWLGDLGPIPSR
jgi:hypothetical protein